jgi:hypothetical protein
MLYSLTERYDSILINHKMKNKIVNIYYFIVLYKLYKKL